MSKAFTKESDAGEDAPPLAARDAALPPGAKNYVTPAGARRLRDELDELVHRARPEAQRAVSTTESADGVVEAAAAQGAARRRLQEIDRRILALTERRAVTEVVDPAAQDPTRVLFGATVTVRDADDREHRYRIVGVDEADARQGRVSWLSPIAKALLGARAGDVVTFRSPRGEEELEVVAVAYERDA